MPKIIVSLLFLFCLASGCKSQQYTYETLPHDQIVFGQGGGMAGEIKTYTLLENGQLFVHSSITKQSEELNSQNPERAKEFFTKLDGMSFNNIQFKHPGNRYYFLGRKTEQDEHKIIWGSEDHNAPDPIKDIYKQLIATLK